MTAFKEIQARHNRAQVTTLAWKLVAASHRCVLTDTQAIVVAAIADYEAAGVKPNQRQLIQATGIDRSTVSNVIRRLVEYDIVKRVRRKADDRAWDVALTDKGKAEAGKIDQIAKKVIDLTKGVNRTDELKIAA